MERVIKCGNCLHFNCAQGRGRTAVCEIGFMEVRIDDEACRRYIFSDNRIDGYRENKGLIRYRLIQLLRATVAGADIKDIQLSLDHTHITVLWNNGTFQEVNVAADSGRQMVRDVLKAIGW